ncbi:hypothetical protein Mapa_006131 [Marchantia paleacea]|nr:hypothetical protein Mapa_006131 [Marchantia paleacea]
MIHIYFDAPDTHSFGDVLKTTWDGIGDKAFLESFHTPILPQSIQPTTFAIAEKTKSGYGESIRNPLCDLTATASSGRGFSGPGRASRKRTYPQSLTT